MILPKNVLSSVKENTKVGFEPFYLYDSQRIKDKCRMFQHISYENKAIHFASMANINLQFLGIVKAEKMNIFVNSQLHLEAAYNAGFRSREIIFTSSALSEKMMKLIESYNVQVNLDSPNQLALWSKLFPGKPVGIRCNIGDNVKPYSTHAGAFIGKESRLGFIVEEIAQISDKHLIKGLHLYVGTDIFDVSYFIECYKQLIYISADFPNLEYLNFGGGFGMSENGKNQFDMEEYNLQVTKLMNEVSRQKGKSIKLILEPGRIIGGNAGYFVCSVTDTKNRPDRKLVGINASTVQFSRPLLYPEIANHPVAVIRNGEQLFSDETYPTTIYGCSTYSRDIFSNKAVLPELQIGDVVVFGNAGSYCASSYMQFLGFPKPEEYFI
jgi:diaminopimelate decarboxylase